MSAADVSSSTAPLAARPGFWQRRLISPIVRQLTQGVSPGKVTFTLALGSVCSLFPFLGFTWLLNLLIGLSLKLNQPIMQTLNQLLTPIHVVMILVYVRWGEWLWGATEHRFSIVEMVQSFTELSFTDFLAKFGWAGIHAGTAWLLSAPLLFIAVYYPLKPMINRLAKARLPQGTA